MKGVLQVAVPGEESPEPKEPKPLLTIYKPMAHVLRLGIITSAMPRCKGCRKNRELNVAIVDAFIDARDQLQKDYPDDKWTLNSVTFFDDDSVEYDFDLNQEQSGENVVAEESLAG